jgi:hypothetical protein
LEVRHFFGPFSWSIATEADQQARLVEVILDPSCLPKKVSPNRVNSYGQGPAKVEFTGCDWSTFARGSNVVANRQPIIPLKQHFVDSSSLAGTD